VGLGWRAPPGDSSPMTVGGLLALTGHVLSITRRRSSAVSPRRCLVLEQSSSPIDFGVCQGGPEGLAACSWSRRHRDGGRHLFLWTSSSFQQATVFQVDGHASGQGEPTFFNAGFPRWATTTVSEPIHTRAIASDVQRRAGAVRCIQRSHPTTCVPSLEHQQRRAIQGSLEAGEYS